VVNAKKDRRDITLLLVSEVIVFGFVIGVLTHSPSEALFGIMIFSAVVANFTKDSNMLRALAWAITFAAVAADSSIAGDNLFAILGAGVALYESWKFWGFVTKK